MSGSVLVEMGELVRATPQLGAPAVQVAAWYERKAQLLDHIARSGDSGSSRIAALARQVHQHAARLAVRAS